MKEKYNNLGEYLKMNYESDGSVTYQLNSIKLTDIYEEYLRFTVPHIRTENDVRQQRRKERLKKLLDDN